MDMRIQSSPEKINVPKIKERKLEVKEASRKIANEHVERKANTRKFNDMKIAEKKIVHEQEAKAKIRELSKEVKDKSDDALRSMNGVDQIRDKALATLSD